MRRAALLVIFVSLGCTNYPKPKQIWIDQYKGLRNIPDPTMARNMLEKICESAAYSGDGSAVVMMLRDFEDEPTRHDELAARCASHLYGQDVLASERVVKLIQNENLRVATHEKLFVKKPAVVEEELHIETPDTKASGPT